LRVTVCELPDDPKSFAPAWENLLIHVREQRSDLVLLPELPFYPWFARTPQFDDQVWRRAQEAHDEMMSRLSVLAPVIVLGTHLVREGESRFNRGFCWTATEGYRGVHDKYYFPDEAEFYERRWFDRNLRDFSLARVGELAIGFLICTEVMFNEWARHYGKLGANIIAVPRASTRHDRWLVAPRMAAIVSGAFVISSTRGKDDLFGGMGLVIGPDGEVLATTSQVEPFATVEIDLAESARAKANYPRDVEA
jgi:predicted amidohydrolase